MTETGRKKECTGEGFLWEESLIREGGGEQTNVAAWAMAGPWDVGCGLMTIGEDEIHV